MLLLWLKGLDALAVGISGAMLGEFSRQQEALLLWLCRWGCSSRVGASSDLQFRRKMVSAPEPHNSVSDSS